MSNPIEFSETYLVQVGELTLKGGNIKDFEKRLVQNLQLYIEKVRARVHLRAGRMIVECPKESCEAVEYALDHLIVITGWAKAQTCEKNIESIKKTCLEIYI